MHLITQGLEILLESGLGRRYPPSALQWGQVPRGKASWEREARPSLLEFQGTGSQRVCPEHNQGSGAPDSKLQSRRPQGAGHSERGGGGGTPTSSKALPPEKTRGWRAKDRGRFEPSHPNSFHLWHLLPPLGWVRSPGMCICLVCLSVASDLPIQSDQWVGKEVV